MSARRILLLDTGNEWGGGTNSMIELLKRIDRSRFDVTCCFYKDYRKGEGGRLLSEELADLGIPLIVMPTRGQPLWAKLAKELARGIFSWSSRLKKRAVRSIEMRWRIRQRAAMLATLLREGGYELLYMNNQPASNLEGYLAGEIAGIPVVQHCRSQPLLHVDEVAIIERSVTRIICVSQGVADVLSAHLTAQSSLRVVHNAIDCHQQLPSPVILPGLIPDLPIVGTVGRLASLKAVDHLLEALGALAAEGVYTNCLVVGEGEQRQALEALAASLGIAAYVHFVGFQENPLAWVRAMDICVLCSSKEGLPRVVLEAMLAAKPVIGSDVTGTRELIVHQETGLLYAYGDVPALTSALRRLLANPPTCHAMGDAGRQRVEAGFSIESYVAGVTAVLDEALA